MLTIPQMAKPQTFPWTLPAIAVKIESRDSMAHFTVVVETRDPAEARTRAEPFMHSDDYVYELSPVEPGTRPMGGPIQFVCHRDNTFTSLDPHGAVLGYGDDRDLRDYRTDAGLDR